MILTPELEAVRDSWKVLRDRVLVKILPYVHPTLITPGVEVHKGVVIAVGPGRRVRKKVRFNVAENLGNFDRAMYFEDGDETGQVLPMEVKSGDVVEFSFRNITLVDFDRVGHQGVGPLAFVWQKAIYSIDPDESLNSCLMWQQSAGFDHKGNFMSGDDWNRV